LVGATSDEQVDVLHTFRDAGNYAYRTTIAPGDAAHFARIKTNWRQTP